MDSSLRRWVPATGWVALLAVAGLLPISGCGSGGSGWDYLGNPFFYTGSSDSTGPSGTGSFTGGQLGQSDRSPGDPCDESLARKFVTISMRNLSVDYIHYFFVAIAFVDVDETVEDAIIPSFDGIPFPDGAVCPSDIALYTQRDYIEIGSGQAREFGDYCIVGPALLYLHRNGQFRLSAGSGTTGLGAAIAPAQGSVPTYDEFFNSGGAQLPVPDLIIFHNPGSGEGASLKVSAPTSSPCAIVITVGAPVCQRDAFYYVSDDDIMAGSRSLGVGSGRRVPAEIQGTGCECTGLSEGFHILAPPRVSAAAAYCNEFLRGGRIEYKFYRQDDTPAFPQLVWRVFDSSGSMAHDFDSRAPEGG